jgi:hypothetical protein
LSLSEQSIQRFGGFAGVALTWCFVLFCKQHKDT